MTDAKVDILLATYNGERYLAEQIESLLAQTFDDWRVIARDDGSSDRTVRILEDYAARHPGRFVLIEDSDAGLGACGNFGRLMEHSTAHYVMFCDQDDVWLPWKIETLMTAMRELEAECGSDAPLLVHSDLRVVDEQLNPIASSFWVYQGGDPSFARSLPRLLAQNVITGCACLCNRRLVELSLPLPDDSLMHDWWIALVAAAIGRVETLRAVTVLYRQHGSNTLGAKRLGVLAMLGRVLSDPVGAFYRTRRTLLSTQRQAGALLGRLAARMTDRRRDIVTLYATLSNLGFIERRALAIRKRFLPSGLVRQLVFLAVI